MEEQIAAIPYDRVTDEAMRRFKLSPEAYAALPNGELRIEVSQFDSTALPHKRIRVNVTWPAADDSVRSVGLTSWKFAPSGDHARSETEK